MTYDVLKLPPRIIIGKEGENKYQSISIDVSKWAITGATFSIVYQRADGTCYPVSVTASNNIITWTPTATDLVKGYGKLEVRMYKGDMIAKSTVTATYCTASIVAGDEPSEETPDWVQEIIDAYEDTDSFVPKTDLDGTTVYYGEDGKVHSASGNIPTKTSQLTNDSEFVTKTYVDGEVSKIVTVSNNVYKFGGYGLMNNGVPNTNSNYWHTDYIPVKQGDVIRVSKRVSWASNGWDNLFDKDKNFLRQPQNSERDVSDQNYDKITITDSYTSYIVLSFSKYDSVTDKDKDVVTINNDFPTSYIEPNAIILEKTIGLSEKQKSEVDNAVSSVKFKPFVLINFDSFNFDDNRFEIVNNEYGFKATVNLGTQYPTDYNETKSNNYKTLFTNGWDCALYSGTNFPVDTYGDLALTDNPSTEVQTAWDNYVAIAVENAKNNGFFEPLTWFARQNKYCVGLEKALSKYDIRLCRGNVTVSTSSIKIPLYFTDVFSSVNSTKNLLPTTVNEIIALIDSAVDLGVGISIFSHGLYTTEEEASANYGCTEDNLRTVLNKIKEYVDADKIDVLTYRDMYSIYKPQNCMTKDYNRIIKLLNYSN